MKVSELNEEVALRGLSKNGSKAFFVARLKEAVTEKTPLISERLLAEVVNNAGHCFQAGAYWESIDANAAIIDESVMEIKKSVSF